ncbi:MAG: tetratricopeptide repeat protein, partial [bacterium]
MSDLIAKYPDLSAINNVYLRIGIELFRTGNFDGAISALGVIGTIGAAPVTAIQIGAPLEIKVVDADMRTRAIDTPLQVTIISTSGDSVQALLKPAFSRGVYIGSIYTALGAPIKGDDILQVRGGDTAAITYIDRLSNDGVNIPRKVSVGFRTDSDLTVISQTAMATYIKIKEYQKLGLIDDKWRIIGELPIDAPAGFRNVNGALFGKGTEIRIADMKRIVPGQGVYIELSEPDAAETDGIDTIPGGRTARTIKVSTRKGKTANVTLTETAPLSGVFAGLVPTTIDANPPAGTLQVEENDTVSVNYLDPDPSKPENASHVGQVSLQKTNGQLAIFQSYSRKQKPDTIFYAQAGRVPDEEKLTLQVNDRDLDMTDGRDTVTVKVAAPGGAELPVLLTETDVHTGIFTGQFQISTKALTAANGILPVKAGDIVTATYTDKQNSSDAPLDVLQTVRVNIAEDAVATLLEQHVELPAEGSTDDPKITWVPVTKVTPGMLYRITVRDGDAISPAGEPLRQPLKITAGTGAAIELNLGGVLDGLDKVATFSGEFYVRLGDAKSPATTLLSRAGQVGKDDLSAEQLRAAGLTSVPTINVQGTDTVTLLYIEPLTADKRTDVPLKLVLKVAADGFVQLFDMQGNPLVDLKPGVPFVIQVTDPTADQTDKNDTVYVAVVSVAGDKLEKVVLSETGPHTGVFLGTIKTVYEKTAADTDKLKVEFGSDISVSYQDIYAISGKTEERKIKLTVDDLAEARAQLLTKVFESQSFEVESTMRLAESLYNLGAVQLSTVKPIAGQKLTNESLHAANVLLTRIIDRFPGSVYEQEALYRSGKISKAEQNYPEAIKLFTNIIEKYSASKFVPKALYELVGIYTSKDVNKIDDAVETTRQLAHGFPNDPMVSEAFIQVAEYYYLVSKDYTMSARIYERLIRRFPDAPKANQMYFRLGSCYWNLGNKEKGVTTDSYVKGGDRYLSYVKLFPDTKQVPDALYWGARCYAAAVKNDNAFTMLQRLVVNYPNSNLAKLAKDMLLTLGNAKPVIDLFD